MRVEGANEGGKGEAEWEGPGRLGGGSEGDRGQKRIIRSDYEQNALYTCITIL